LSNQIGKIRNVLDSWFTCKKHFLKILQKLFGVVLEFENFSQISIIERIIAQEINFLQSENFTVCMV
jgi:hypothetical protein